MNTVSWIVLCTISLILGLIFGISIKKVHRPVHGALHQKKDIVDNKIYLSVEFYWPIDSILAMDQVTLEIRPPVER